jgi:hypothetical protein
MGGLLPRVRSSKQHGHSVTPMLNMYAAWTEGAKESDVEAIKQAPVSPDLPVDLPVAQRVSLPRLQA